MFPVEEERQDLIAYLSAEGRSVERCAALVDKFAHDVAAAEQDRIFALRDFMPSAPDIKCVIIPLFAFRPHKETS